jgi:outer membrane protein TolC
MKNRELQQANVDAEQKKFENGMSTSFLVLQAQDALRSAERRQNLAIVDYNKSLASLEKSKGTLLEARDIKIARASTPWVPHPSDFTTDLRGIIGR